MQKKKKETQEGAKHFFTPLYVILGIKKKVKKISLKHLFLALITLTENL